MASNQPIVEKPSRSRTLTQISSITSKVRFNSARIAPAPTTENTVEDEVESIPLAPCDIQIDEEVVPSDENSSINNLKKEESTDQRLITISEYCAPENTPFQPFTPKISPKKLHRYILLTPRTVYSVSLFTILSIATVLIGFGVAVSYRRTQLDFHCSLLSYCPRDSSYTVICNVTNRYCQCYNNNDQLIGCIQQRKYGEGCYRFQECDVHYNLQCQLNIYQCRCLDHYRYNGTLCVPLLTYGDTCSILNDTCDHSLNLTCLAGNICTCDTTNTFWNGEYCESYRLVNSPCDPYKTPSGCSMTLTCDNSTATCQCPSSTYLESVACLPYSSYLEPCFDSSSCLPNSLLACSYGACVCDDLYFYWSPSNATCVYPKRIDYNATCDYQTGCESDFGLHCINGRCLCEINSYWTPGNYCDFQSQYNEQCLTAPCLAYSGLTCISNICTCSPYYYWDNYICQYQRGHSSFCLADQWCRMDLGLRCRNFTCTCSLCTTCFWDGVRCRDCPTSWQVVVSNGTIQPRVYCYLKVDSYVHWNESVAYCSTAATSYFGTTSHLIYIDDTQELQDVSTFATTAYYDIFIGHTNQFNYTQWSLTNQTKSPSMNWCTGISTTYPNTTCARLLISLTCITNIQCYGWTSRYICELD